MSELKVYSIDGDEYWFAAKSEKEAIEEYYSEYGQHEDGDKVDIRELSEKELNKLEYFPDHTESDDSITFKERLDEIIKEGVNVPVHFASSLDNI